MDSARLSQRIRTTALGATVAIIVVALGQPGGIQPAAAAGSTVRVPVLMYHRISVAPPGAALPHLWVSPRRFRAHLKALKRAGWRTITAEELGRAIRDGRAVGPKRFVITIDDGARDGWSNAALILRALGMRATFCVLPGRARRPWQLDPVRLRKLHAAGHEIANHSLTHPDLRRLGIRALRHQILGAQRLIRRFVGHRPRTFCYPMGFHDAAVREVVRAAGNLMAFTTVEGARHSGSRRLVAPRVRVNGWDSARGVLASVRP
jgi:peptidoglycan/xylan/chitin deacetylase (PgdA/CDA1 family)